MAKGKRGPTLYELLGRGKVDVERNGSIRLPHWLRDRRSETEPGQVPVTAAPAEMQPAVEAETDVPTQQSRHVAAAAAASAVKTVASRDASRPTVTGGRWGIELRDGRVTFSVGIHTLVVAVLGLSVLMLAVFKLGQSSGKKIARAEVVKNLYPSPTKGDLRTHLTEQMASGPMDRIRQQRPRPEVIQLDAKATSPGAVAIRARVQETGTLRSTEPSNADLQRRVGYYYFVLRSSRSKEDMLPIARYLNDNGIAVTIEKAGSWWAIKTRDGFARRNSTEAKAMLSRIMAVGRKYKASGGVTDFSDCYLRQQ